MAGTLPLELLSQIAGYLNHGGESLVPYTVVCRRWQPVFEQFIYSKNLVVHSTGDVDESPQPGISLTRFTALTSGVGMARRAWIRHVQYNIVVPYELPDWTTRKHKGYQLKNPLLNSWGSGHRLSLQLGLVGREQGEEPCTSSYPDAWEYTWEFRNGRTKATKPYRACFPNHDASMLPQVACIHKLSFMRIYEPSGVERDHQVWAQAIFQIVQHCPTIVELHVDLDYLTRPDQLEYIQARRQAVSDGLSIVPRSLQVFGFINQKEGPWKTSMPALNVLSSEVDRLAVTLRDLSFSLRVLKLNKLSLSLDFLCPLDDDGQPKTTSLCWPHLEVIELSSIPPWLPSGKWLLRPKPEAEADIAAIDDWEEEICHSERGHVARRIMEVEQFHRLFISLGYAARHMPRLTSLQFNLNATVQLNFKFAAGVDGVSATWSAKVDYRPDQRVAAAWGFREDDLQPGFPWRTYTLQLNNWPPDEVQS
ncbi:F-box protein [Aspergillus ibericus CBS 121593]|uniref:Uncharacterized protein n=1 Tax=Aspergillus ibericus CBS 121593 TaxID=1448316 RepID=A0A395H3L7_9EURO|nr:hypothetical protein BO80DRAFT_493708 [Aspergillus ibericus CBS 121593]RAL00814.1 hypothetical protein BO80DRAFT_493708 [Aspergillus ibericus CBS 121593]